MRVCVQVCVRASLCLGVCAGYRGRAGCGDCTDWRAKVSCTGGAGEDAQATVDGGAIKLELGGGECGGGVVRVVVLSCSNGIAVLLLRAVGV